jgi:hypothetical protein
MPTGKKGAKFLSLSTEVVEPVSTFLPTFKWQKSHSWDLSVCMYFFFWVVLGLARQMHYHLSHISSPFCCRFSDITEIFKHVPPSPAYFLRWNLTNFFALASLELQSSLSVPPE